MARPTRERAEFDGGDVLKPPRTSMPAPKAQCRCGDENPRAGPVLKACRLCLGDSLAERIRLSAMDGRREGRIVLHRNRQSPAAICAISCRWRSRT